MMRRYVNMLMAMLVASAVVIPSVGCNFSDDTVKLIALNSGLAASVTWIAFDNPDAAGKQAVQSVLSILKDGSTNIQSGKTYMEVVFPQVEAYVNSGILAPQYKPIALTGAISALQGIDLLLISNPSWKEQQGLAVAVVSHFVIGFEQGLRLADDDQRIVVAQQASVARARAFQKVE